MDRRNPRLCRHFRRSGLRGSSAQDRLRPLVGGEDWRKTGARQAVSPLRRGRLRRGAAAVAGLDPGCDSGVDHGVEARNRPAVWVGDGQVVRSFVSHWLISASSVISRTSVRKLRIHRDELNRSRRRGNGSPHPRMVRGWRPPRASRARRPHARAPCPVVARRAPSSPLCPPGRRPRTRGRARLGGFPAAGVWSIRHLASGGARMRDRPEP